MGSHVMGFLDFGTLLVTATMWEGGGHSSSVAPVVSGPLCVSSPGSGQGLSGFRPTEALRTFLVLSAHTLLTGLIRS